MAPGSSPGAEMVLVLVRETGPDRVREITAADLVMAAEEEPVPAPVTVVRIAAAKLAPAAVHSLPVKHSSVLANMRRYSPPA